jgi:hypothetical protein
MVKAIENGLGILKSSKLLLLLQSLCVELLLRKKKLLLLTLELLVQYSNLLLKIRQLRLSRWLLVR